MRHQLPIITEPDVVPALVAYLQKKGLGRLTLVADDNTFAALGQRVALALEAQGFDLKVILLEGEEVVPDEAYIMRVLLAAGDEERAYLSVGSGVITDIVRFVSHRTRTPFIALPTAPSVDGYTSISSSLVLERLKVTVPGKPPQAIFADLDTLCAAPRPMLAAGFADVVAKYTSVADWKLGHLFWDTPYDEAIAQRAETARDTCVARVDQIAKADAAGVRSLMDALAETGLCMLDFGMSHPAGGSEHYISHVWELKLLQEGKPAILHGAKVGVATVLIAGIHEQIRALSREEAARRLAAVPLPDRVEEEARIRTAYGHLGEVIIAEQEPFLRLDEVQYEAIKQAILNGWDRVQQIAHEVPAPAQMIAWLRQVGGPVTASDLGFGAADEKLAFETSHYFRNRFTVVKLGRMLGLMP